jgi:hypothetical protein
MNTNVLKERELRDAELEAVTGGEDKPLAPVIKAVATKWVDYYCSTPDGPPVCPIPIQPH